MKKISLLVSFFSLLLSAQAQKRNNVFAGFNFDNLVKVKNFNTGNPDLIFKNKFLFTFGYERLIGNRIALSLTTGKYFSGEPLDINQSSTSSGDVAYYPEKGTTINQNGNNYSLAYYYINSGAFDFTNNLYFKYESKYFFSDFEDDGKASAYVSANYTRVNFTAKVTEVVYEGYNEPFTYPNTIRRNYPEQKVSINRVGLKLGVGYANYTGSDLSLGFDYNIPNQTNNTWNLPIDFRTVSFNINWVWYIPF